MANSRKTTKSTVAPKKVLGRASRRVVCKTWEVPVEDELSEKVPDKKKRGRPAHNVSNSSDRKTKSNPGPSSAGALSPVQLPSCSRRAPVARSTPAPKSPAMKKKLANKSARLPTPKKSPVKKKSPLRKPQRTVNVTKKRKASQPEQNESDSDVSDEEPPNKVPLLKKKVARELEKSFNEAPVPRPNNIGEEEDYFSEDSDEQEDTGTYQQGVPVSDVESDDVVDLLPGNNNMVLDNEEFDHDTPAKDLFCEGKEEEMCDMWREEKSLYIFSEPGHRDPNHRTNVIRRMAVILQIRPEAIRKRMESLRSQYQRMHREAKSGSAQQKYTDRQLEIMRLCSFLRNHIKSQPSVTTYSGYSPAPNPNETTSRRQLSSNNPGSSQSSQSSQSTPILKLKRNVIENTFKGLLGRVNNWKDLLITHRQLTGQDPDPNLEYDTAATARARGTDVINVVDHTSSHNKKKGEDSSFEITPPPKFCRNQRLRDQSVEEEHTDVIQQEERRRSPRGHKTDQPVNRGKAGKKIIPKKSSAGIALANANKAKKPFINYGLPSTSEEDNPKRHEHTKKKVITEKKYLVNYSNLDNLAWFEKQGPGYRKAKDTAAQKKKELSQVMQDKAETLSQMQKDLAHMGRDIIQRNVDKEEDADSLWAKSLVPHLKRMDQDSKDKFMVFVLSKAFDVIGGKNLV